MTPTTNFKTLSTLFTFGEGEPGELQALALLGVLGVLPPEELHLGVNDAPSIALRSGVLCMVMIINYYVNYLDES